MIQTASPVDETVEEFLRRAESFAERSGLKISYVSRQIFNEGKKIDLLRRGGGIEVTRLTRAHARLDELERSLSTKQASPP